MTVKSPPRTWKATVAFTLRENYSPGVIFEYQEYIRKFLRDNVDYLCCIGATPEKTLSRILQELREMGLIKFLDRGEYKIRRHISDEELSKAGKGSQGEDFVRKILSEFEGGLIEEIEEQKTFPDMRDKGLLRFDFYITLSVVNFLGYKLIVLEFNGLQHRDSVKFFGGWDSLLDGWAKTNIKKEKCARDHILFIEIEKLNEKHIRKVITTVLKQKLSERKFQKIAQEEGFLYHAVELPKTWEIWNPTFATYKSPTFIPTEKVITFHLDEALILEESDEISLQRGRKRKIKNLIGRGYSVIFVGRQMTEYTQDADRYRDKLEKFIDLLNLPIMAMIAFGKKDPSCVKFPLFAEAIKKIFPRRRKAIYVTGTSDKKLDQSSPKISIFKNIKFNCEDTDDFFDN